MPRRTPPTELPLDGPRLELLREVLARGGHVRLRAVGGSMAPAIAHGDELVIGPLAPAGPRPGEVVLWAYRGAARVHRVVRVGPEGVLTRGDALPAPEGPVPASALLGRVVGVRSRLLQRIWARLRRAAR